MAIKKPKISTAGEARENLLSAAEILHEDFEKTGDLKVITQALKAYNIALNTSKVQIAYQKMTGNETKKIKFLE
jgi:hypothetical protein